MLLPAPNQRETLSTAQRNGDSEHVMACIKTTQNVSIIQASDSNWQVTVRTSQNCYIEVHSDVITWHFVLWISSTQTHRSVQRHLPQSISSHHPWYLHIYKFTKLNTESSNKIMSGSGALFWLSGWRKFISRPKKGFVLRMHTQRTT